jgi:hypothetical protein
METEMKLTDVKKDVIVEGKKKDEADITNISGIDASAENFEANQIAVFPNPSNGIFNIAFGNLNPTQIDVYDISGKLILEKKQLEISNNQTNIDLSKTSDGVYFVKITTEDNTITKRIIKN